MCTDHVTVTYLGKCEEAPELLIIQKKRVCHRLFWKLSGVGGWWQEDRKCENFPDCACPFTDMVHFRSAWFWNEAHSSKKGETQPLELFFSTSPVAWKLTAMSELLLSSTRSVLFPWKCEAPFKFWCVVHFRKGLCEVNPRFFHPLIVEDFR